MKWDIFAKLYAQLVVGKEKAIGAFIAGLAVTFAAHYGLTVDPTASAAIVTLVAFVVGLVNHQVVYWTSNTK